MYEVCKEEEGVGEGEQKVIEDSVFVWEGYKGDWI